MTTPLDIQSLQNPRVKDVMKLRKKRHRDELGLFIIDGFRDLIRALELGVAVREVFLDPGSEPARDADFIRAVEKANLELVACSSAVMDKLSYRENPEGVLGIAESKPCLLSHLKLSENPMVLVADGLEKPGNIGALLRSADAVGVDAVILSDCVTDVYNPNVIRSSTGTLFSQPVVSADGEEVRVWLREQGLKIVITRPDAEQNYMTASLTPPVAIVMGAEDAGLSDDWLEIADLDLHIPMKGLADSLNVSAAATLLLYEAMRQSNFLTEQAKPKSV